MLFTDKWVNYFFKLCDIAAGQSKDLTTQVGAIVVGDVKSVLLTAFNGFPIGVIDDLKKVPERYERPNKYVYTAHAEQNLVALAARHGIKLNNTTVFVNLQPCATCVNLLIQAGVKTIYYKKDNGTGEWRKDIDKSIMSCIEAGIEIHEYLEPDDSTTQYIERHILTMFEHSIIVEIFNDRIFYSVFQKVDVCNIICSETLFKKDYNVCSTVDIHALIASRFMQMGKSVDMKD